MELNQLTDTDPFYGASRDDVLEFQNFQGESTLDPGQVFQFRYLQLSRRLDDTLRGDVQLRQTSSYTEIEEFRLLQQMGPGIIGSLITEFQLDGSWRKDMIVAFQGTYMFPFVSEFSSKIDSALSIDEEKHIINDWWDKVCEYQDSLREAEASKADEQNDTTQNENESGPSSKVKRRKPVTAADPEINMKNDRNKTRKREALTGVSATVNHLGRKALSFTGTKVNPRLI